MHLVCIHIDGGLVGCSMYSAGGKWSQREGGTQGQNLGYIVTELSGSEETVSRAPLSGMR
jgi:hypothetical protein